jgi:hypothetical protein
LRRLAVTALIAVAVALSPTLAAHAATGPGTAGVAPAHKAPVASTTRCTTATPGATSDCVRVQQLPLSTLTPAQRTERAKLVRSRLRTTNAPAAVPAASAVTIVPPTQCNFVPSIGGTSVYTANPDRFTSCADTFWTVTNTETVDGVTDVSVFFFEDLQWASYSATQSIWAHGMVTIGYPAPDTGVLADGFSGTLSSNCTVGGAGVCTATSLTSPDPQTVAITPDSVSYFGWGETDTGPASTAANSDTILDGTLGVVWDILAPPPPTEAVDVAGAANGPVSGLVGRCDTIATSTDGCVNEDFTPTLTYDSRANPLVEPVAQHIYTAQTATPANGGLLTKWGVPPSVNSNGAPLFRDMNQADINANRNAACGKVTVPPGDSCDEYPLASTYEGAAFNSDYSTAPVPLSANNSQGGITSNFYTSNKVIDSDTFYVRAILLNGTASW